MRSCRIGFHHREHREHRGRKERVSGSEPFCFRSELCALCALCGENSGIRANSKPFGALGASRGNPDRDVAERGRAGCKARGGRILDVFNRRATQQTGRPRPPRDVEWLPRQAPSGGGRTARRRRQAAARRRRPDTTSAKMPGVFVPWPSGSSLDLAASSPQWYRP